MNDTLEIIMSLGEIPDNSIVRKITGGKLYKVIRQFVIYAETPSKKQTINCEDGTAFLMSSDIDEDYAININSYSSDKKVVWIVDKQTFYQFLGSQLDEHI